MNRGTGRQSLTALGSISFLGIPLKGGGLVGKRDRKQAQEVLSRKNYYRWEALRRTEAYRQAWQAAFEEMIARLDRKINPLTVKDLLTMLGYDEPGFRDHVVSQAEVKELISCDPDFFEQEIKTMLEKKFVTSPEGKKLAEKFRLTMPWPPNFPDWARQTIKFDNSWPLFIDQPVQLILPKTVRFYPESRIPFLCSLIENKRYLSVKVDLTLPKEQVMAIFEKTIDTYAPLVKGGQKLPKGKSYDDTIDPFMVWDMIHDEGKTAWQVAKELMPNEETNKAEDNIRTLYKKAQDLILEQEEFKR
jgi:hypothetical protein